MLNNGALRAVIPNFGGSVLRRLAFTVIAAAALAGCAQMPSQLTQLGDKLTGSKPAPAGPLMDFVVPADALAARDQELTSILARAGALASKQSQPMTITVFSGAQDFGYMKQSIGYGIAAQRVAAVAVENVPVQPGQPTHVQIQIKATQ